MRLALIDFYIRNQKLSKNGPAIVAGSIKYVDCSFTFKTRDWDGLDKWLLLEKGGEISRVELVDDAIPKERGLNIGAGIWHISLFGEGEDGTRITTDSVTVEVEESPLTEGGPLPVLEQTEAEQIAAKSQSAFDKASEALIAAKAVKEAAENGEFDGYSPKIDVSYFENYENKTSGAVIKVINKDGSFNAATVFDGKNGERGSRGEQGPAGENATEEQIAKAVEDYFEENPVPGGGGIGTETDPTVPAWAKQPTKPTYTAKEVGALPADTVIPDEVHIGADEPSDPNAKIWIDPNEQPPTLNFTGAVNGTWNGTEDKTINIPTIAGEPGKSITIDNIVESELNGKRSTTITFSDDSEITINDGADGADGKDGKSAYQYAKDGGYTGTEAEFAAKLAEEIPQADWNQNDPAAADYVKNKTHWAENIEEVLVEETVFLVEDELVITEYEGELIWGDTYIVNWNGTKYICTAKMGTGDLEGLVYIGNPLIYGFEEDTGEPFFGLVDGILAFLVIPEDGLTEVTLSVARKYMRYHKLPGEYMDSLVIPITEKTSDGVSIHSNITYDANVLAYYLINNLPVWIEITEGLYPRYQITSWYHAYPGVTLEQALKFFGSKTAIVLSLFYIDGASIKKFEIRVNTTD